MTSVEYRWCEWCDVELEEKLGEYPWNWKKRRFCDKRCAAWNREFVKRSSRPDHIGHKGRKTGTLEAPWSFANRKEVFDGM